MRLGRFRFDLLLHILHTAWFVCCLFGVCVGHRSEPCKKSMNRSRCGLGAQIRVNPMNCSVDGGPDRSREETCMTGLCADTLWTADSSLLSRRSQPLPRSRGVTQPQCVLSPPVAAAVAGVSVSYSNFSSRCAQRYSLYKYVVHCPPLPWRTEKPIPHFPPCYKILAAPLAIQSYVKSHRRVAKSNRSLLNSVDSLQQHERYSCQSPNNSVAI